MNQVALRYVSALLDMAEAAGVADKVAQDMRELGAMLAESSCLRRLAEDQQLVRAQKANGIGAIAEAAAFQSLTGRFLCVLAYNGRLNLLALIIKVFHQETARRRGTAEAVVETAYPLSAAQTEALRAALSKAAGADVTLDVRVNKDLLGGMTVTLGSLMIDDSVRRKLERLQRAMSSGSNENQTVLQAAG